MKGKAKSAFPLHPSSFRLHPWILLLVLGALGHPLAGLAAFALAGALDRVAVELALVVDRHRLTVALAGHVERQGAVLQLALLDLRLLVVAADDDAGHLLALRLQLGLLLKRLAVLAGSRPGP